MKKIQFRKLLTTLASDKLSYLYVTRGESGDSRFPVMLHPKQSRTQLVFRVVAPHTNMLHLDVA